MTVAWDSRGETDRRGTSPATLDVEAALEEIRGVLWGVAAHKNVRVRLAVAPDVTGLYAAPASFRRIVLPLLRNAVKFSPEHHAVTVSAVMRHSPRVLEIAVMDQGVGVEEEVLAREMEADAESDLADVRRLIELHGGALRISSGAGRGSTFAVTFPAFRLAPIADAPPHGIRSADPGQRPRLAPPFPVSSDVVAPLPAEAPEENPTVLLLEDNLDTAERLTACLEAVGYAVTLARDTVEAAYLARVLCPLARLLPPFRYDSRAPLGELRRIPATASLPLLAISVPTSDPASDPAALPCFVKETDSHRLLTALEPFHGDAGRPGRVVILDAPAEADTLIATLTRNGFASPHLWGMNPSDDEALEYIPDAIVVDPAFADLNHWADLRRFLNGRGGGTIPVFLFTTGESADRTPHELSHRLKALLSGPGEQGLWTALDRLKNATNPERQTFDSVSPRRAA